MHPSKDGLASRVVKLERTTIASFDGTPLGVQSSGPTDAPVLLLANGAGATVSAYRFIIERFAGAFRFVSWDYRGLHSSGRPLRGYQGLTIKDHAQDAIAVMDWARPSAQAKVHALAWSMGVQVLLEAQLLQMRRSGAQRFQTLVLHNGTPGNTWDTIGGDSVKQGALRPFIDPVLRTAQRADGLIERTLARAVEWRHFIPLAIRAGMVHKDIDRAVFAEVARGFKDIDIHLYLEILRRLGQHDATEVLAQVQCPTLILQGTKDIMTPMSAAQLMAQRIPNARLVLLHGGTHYAAVEMPALVNQHLEEFWATAEHA